MVIPLPEADLRENDFLSGCVGEKQKITLCENLQLS